MMKRLVNKLFEPIDIAPLVFFRISFGALMLWEVWRYFSYERIRYYFIEPQFYFHFWGFAWLKPLPGQGMVWLFYGLGFLSLCIIFGFRYRLAMGLFCIGFTYIFLLDQANYLNHFYLICLFSFLMIFVPAHRALSLDAWFNPKIRARTAPGWALWLLRGQMALVYIYGGIAKINSDWLHGEPIGTWLRQVSSVSRLGWWYKQVWTGYFFAYGGLFFDLLIVPLILWRRTRWIALAVALGFHIMNSRLFNIGIFPALAVAATLIFLPPHYFRYPFWKKSVLLHAEKAVDKLDASAGTVQESSSATRTVSEKWLLRFLTVYFVIQILLPLRHFLIPGYMSWTEEGHTLAWHMKLRSKEGETILYAANPHDGSARLIPLDMYLMPGQIHEMQDNPQMLVRFAQFLVAGDYAGMEIHARSMFALNERAPQLLIDPAVNLAAQPDDLLPDDWILPLMQPYPHQPARPTLLLSRRYADVLLLINATEVEFPLAGLELDFGASRLSNFPVMSLPPLACIIVYHDEASVERVSPFCNEEGRIALDTAFTELNVYFDDRRFARCVSLSCVVTVPD